MKQIKFKYNGKIWYPKNPEKKLKQLGITWDDVKIIEEVSKEVVDEPDTSIKKYYFKNSKGETIVSIYNNLKHLEDIIPDIDDYEQCYK